MANNIKKGCLISLTIREVGSLMKHCISPSFVICHLSVHWRGWEMHISPYYFNILPPTLDSHDTVYSGISPNASFFWVFFISDHWAGSRITPGRYYLTCHKRHVCLACQIGRAALYSETTDKTRKMIKCHWKIFHFVENNIEHTRKAESYKKNNLHAKNSHSYRVMCKYVQFTFIDF